jgi:hypothetical protein
MNKSNYHHNDVILPSPGIKVSSTLLPEDRFEDINDWFQYINNQLNKVYGHYHPKLQPKEAKPNNDSITQVLRR